MDYLERGARLFDDDHENTRDINHATDSEYKRLRNQADDMYKKRNQLSQQSQQAFKSGDKQRAHDLSQQAKQILEQAEDVNRKAAEYVFRENNSDSAADEIDLHGLYVKEAEYILKNRIAAAIRTNQSHLRVIVGKGLHSANGIAKLKPAVDQLCDESGLRHRIDPKNSGVLEIDLTNTQSSQIPNHWGNSSITQPQQAYHGSSSPQYQQGQQGGYQGGYQQQQQQNHSGGTGNIHTGNQLVDLLIKGLCMCLKSK